jgi:hypothetical protein
MTRLTRLAAALAFAGAAFLATAPAYAASVTLCEFDQASKASGPRRVVNPNTGDAYVTNGQGCALILYSDVGYFQSQGWTLGTPYIAQSNQGNVQTGGLTFVLPAGTIIRDIIWQEVSNVTPTGGIRMGTTSGGSQVVAGFALAASSLVSTPEVSMLERVFPTTTSILTPTTLYVTPVTSWAGSAVDVTVIYGYF